MAARTTSLVRQREQLEVDMLMLKIKDMEAGMSHRESMLKNEFFRTFIQGLTWGVLTLGGVLAALGWLVLNYDKVKAFLS